MAHHDRCVFCGGFRLLFFSLAGTGPVCKEYHSYLPDTARIVIFRIHLFSMKHSSRGQESSVKKTIFFTYKIAS